MSAVDPPSPPPIPTAAPRDARATAAAAGPASASPVPASSAPAFANPSLSLEPELGLVVIQFRDAAGAVTLSIPSARQIAAYLHAGSVTPDPDAVHPPSTGPAHPVAHTIRTGQNVPAPSTAKAGHAAAAGTGSLRA